MQIHFLFIPFGVLITRSVNILFVKKNYQPLFLCNFQFVMDLKSKKMAFEINAEHTKVQHSNFALVLSNKST